MKRLLLLFLAISLFNGISAQTDRNDSRDEYRRSSLCLVLLTHRDKKYAAEMERVFRNFPMPARYNEHNISDVRVISVRGKKSRSDIEYLLRKNDIARKVVSRWFNRNEYTGCMDMDLVHERGGYGAFYSDYKRSQSTVRGTDLLREEGIELLQSTFVLVCDMDYIDKKKGAAWGAVGMALLSAGMQVAAQQNYNRAQQQAASGNYASAQRRMQEAQSWQAGSMLTTAGAMVVADIGGFRVKMKAYLYKLRWDDDMTQTLFNEYWCDSETPYDEKQKRMKKFADSREFVLDFVGRYKATSSKTILRSWKNEDEVILDVCSRCVNKGLKELAEQFPVFRPRTPFYFDNGTMYSHIGLKEEVAIGKKYEIIRRHRNRKGVIYYKRVGKVVAGAPWDNRNVRFDRYFDEGQKGTKFHVKKAKVDLKNTPALQIREL